MNFVARGAGLAMLMGMTAGASEAAITADQLWAAWQDAGAQAGLAVSAEAVTREGTSLRLSGVTVSVGTAADAATVSEAVIDEILLTEGADGSVTILPSAELRMSGGDDAIRGSLALRHDGGSIRVTEALGEMVYDLTAAELVADLSVSAVSALTKSDGSEARADYAVSVALVNPAVKVTDTPDLNRTVDFAIAAQALNYAVQATDEGMDSTSAQTSTTADVAITGRFAAPRTLAMADLSTPAAWAAALSEGMALTLQSTQGQSESSVKDESPFASMDVTATALPGTAAFALSKDGYDLRATGGGLQATVRTPDLPVPEVTLNMGPLEFGIAMPIMAGDAAGNFGLTLKLSDITANEEVWGLIDPTAQLPRDPAQVTLVTSGTMLIDILAMMAAEGAGMTEVVPPQPLTLDIRELAVSAAGALLTGSGAFTFDNASGQPVPAGEANVTLTGGNALIDGLIAIGVLTEEDAGGARMMMAMFMDATGDDVLTSKIEAKADGSISVNGQRVQ